ncbi:hypothetical protein CKO25_17925 [Thiocapsa imhoffii]|uniref:Uncharacterized protein n=1 Tax=Thiocapsa imhoffii TaxID=382777 RepID=A0A9X1BA07_9GAMM|nr:hypothetical protein [Thiocapsa imhoffii]MBK1646489.1 hypothetical protein [Thiocapsa imhoffii]
MIGTILGLGPALWLATHRQEWPWLSRVGPIASVSTNDDTQLHAQACTDLDAKATRLFLLLDRLPYDLPTPYVLSTRTEVSQATVVSDSTDRVQVTDVNANGSSQGRIGKNRRPRLQGEPSKETLKIWWEVLAEAQTYLAFCRDSARPRMPAPSEGESLVDGAVSLSVPQFIDAMVALSGRLTDLLDEVARLRPAGEAFGEAFPTLGQTTLPESGNATTIATRRYFTDWNRGWTYGFAELSESSLGNRLDSDAFRDASNVARLRLLEGLLTLMVSPNRSMRDVVADYPSIWTGLRHRVDVAEVKARRSQLGNVLWVEATLPLAGTAGLMPILLPFFMEGQRREQGPLEQGRMFGPTAPNDEVAIPVTYTGILVDTRGLIITPALIPRFISPSGALINITAKVDANRVARHGFSVYTPFYGQARLKVGPDALWLKPTAVSLESGDFRLDEADTARLSAAQISGESVSAPLVLLTD